MKRTFLITLVFCHALAWSGPLQQTHSSKGNQKVQAEQIGSASAPLFVSGEIATKKDKAEADEDAQQRSEKAVVDAALVKYTLWLAIATALLVVAAAVQAGLFVWQLRLIASSAKDAKTAADAALLTAKSNQLADRSWMSVVEVSHHTGQGEDNEGAFRVLYFEFVWVNSGHTPAIDCRVFTDGRLFPLSEQEPVVPLFAPSFDQEKKMTVFPNGRLRPSAWHVMDKDLELLIGRKARAFVYGRLEYRDVFSDTPRHTEACFEVIYQGVRVVDHESKPKRARHSFRFNAVGPQNTAA